MKQLDMKQYKVLKNKVFVLRNSGVRLTLEQQQALEKYQRACTTFEPTHGLTGRFTGVEQR